MKKIMNMRRAGFTLIEILMAILIIVILAVVGITQFNNFAADAKNAATKSNLAILRNSIGVMNALERVRCSKVIQDFPDIGTLQSNDITGCSCTAALCTAGAAPLLTASCNPTTLVDPITGLVDYGACPGTTAASPYLNLIPLIDRPFVQNGIPNNPWTAAVSTVAPNRVNADTAPVSPAVKCAHAPTDTAGALVKATRCSAGGAFNGTSATLEAGWCYCQASGLIWANSGNNNGLGNGTGLESTF
jgi:prepilin-type N-terminal cleavage/methylation domain-containing protein